MAGTVGESRVLEDEEGQVETTLVGLARAAGLVEHLQGLGVVVHLTTAGRVVADRALTDADLAGFTPAPDRQEEAREAVREFVDDVRGKPPTARSPIERALVDLAVALGVSEVGDA